jgi:predicted RNase H-like nuclease (RuvC/YqgF family)
MNIRGFAVPALALGALLAVSPYSFADENTGARTTGKDISRKAGETGRAIKDYTVEQRDQAVAQAKSALDDLDRRIGRLETKLDNGWERMDAAGRRKGRAALDKLRKERNEAAEWYGALKHGSAESWEQVKDGFAKSYETLKESFAKARKEF